MSQNLKLGIIGLNPGNGHPYSWPAIFNGYESGAMANCPFPSIPRYLSARRFPQDAIDGAEVTHVWTEDRAQSEHIAAAARISNVVDRPEQMLDVVDAVLLARDDADRHYELALPFLTAGVPIFIDKPLAFDVATAEMIYSSARKPETVFTGSALKYAAEYQLTADDREGLGALRYIAATVPKSWSTYAIHAIDPILAISGRYDAPVSIRREETGPVTSLDWSWHDGPSVRIVASGKVGAPFAIELFGDFGYRRMVWEDAFEAFRTSLRRFVDIVRGHQPPQDREEVMAAIRLIEAGRAGKAQ